MYPVIIITGQAGSGKDTLAGFMAEHGGVCISQADPMKRFVKEIFGFSDQQLWGPSEARNAPDPRPASEFIRLWDDGSAFSIKAAWLKNIRAGGRMEDLQNWAAKHVLGVEGLTPRKVLQTIGTEFGRAIDEKLWLSYAQDMATRILEAGGTYDRAIGHLPGPQRAKFVIITDGRFRNEILVTKALGGLAIRVDGGGLSGEAGSHASETEQNSIPETWFDAVVMNQKSDGLERLKAVAGALVEKLLPAPRKFRTDYLLVP